MALAQQQKSVIFVIHTKLNKSKMINLNLISQPLPSKSGEAGRSRRLGPCSQGPATENTVNKEKI